MEFFSILEESSKEGVFGFQKQNRLFTKKGKGMIFKYLLIFMVLFFNNFIFISLC